MIHLENIQLDILNFAENTRELHAIHLLSYLSEETKMEHLDEIMNIISQPFIHCKARCDFLQKISLEALRKYHKIFFQLVKDSKDNLALMDLIEEEVLETYADEIFSIIKNTDDDEYNHELLLKLPLKFHKKRM